VGECCTFNYQRPSDENLRYNNIPTYVLSKISTYDRFYVDLEPISRLVNRWLWISPTKSNSAKFIACILYLPYWIAGHFNESDEYAAPVKVAPYNKSGALDLRGGPTNFPSHDLELINKTNN